MRAKVLLLTLPFILTGCISTAPARPLPVHAMEQLKGKVIKYVERPMPLVLGQWASNVLFRGGVLEAVLAPKAPRELVAEYHVQNPLTDTSIRLQQALSAELSMQEGEPVRKAGLTAEEIATAAGHVGYVLDVRVKLWYINYFALDWTHYKVMFWTDAKLVDATNGSVIASGSCRYEPESNDGAPTYDELVANNAQRFKDAVSVASKSCAQQLKAELLKRA